MTHTRQRQTHTHLKLNHQGKKSDRAVAVELQQPMRFVNANLGPITPTLTLFSRGRGRGSERGEKEMWKSQLHGKEGDGWEINGKAEEERELTLLITVRKQNYCAVGIRKREGMSDDDCHGFTNHQIYMHNRNARLKARNGHFCTSKI